MGATVDWGAVWRLLFEIGGPAALILLAIVLAAVRKERRRAMVRRAVAAESAAIARAREVLSGRPQR